MTALLVNLFEDILVTICKHLDIQDRINLARTCKTLRDRLYSPVFWDDVIVRITDRLDQETIQSLTGRSINVFRLDRCAGQLELEDLLSDDDLRSSITAIVMELDSNNESGSWRRYPKQTAQISEIFDSLTCLIVYIYNDDFYGELDCDHIHNVLSRVFPMMPRLTELHVYHEDGLDTTTIALEELILKHLPCLESLEYRLFEQQRGFICHHEDQTISSVIPNTKLLCLDGYQTCVQKLSQTYPCLRHWSLGRIDNSVMMDGVGGGGPLLPMPSVRSIEVKCKGCCRQHALYYDELKRLFNLFPNLVAINVSTLGLKAAYHLSNLLKVVSEVCPNIVVLDLMHTDKVISEYDLSSVIKKLNHLRVLILPYEDHSIPSKYSDEIVDELAKHLPQLQSLIGFSADKGLDQISTLEYRTSSIVPYCVVKKSSTSKQKSSWRRIQPYTAPWHEAFGTKYFRPKSQIPNLEFVHRHAPRYATV